MECRLKLRCLGKTAKEKKFSVTYYKAEYERNIKRLNSPQGNYIKGKWHSTVKPVFGALTQFMGLRKINTIGIKQANKVMHLAAMAYNLKKYLKFTQKLAKTKAKAIGLIFFKINGLQNVIIFNLRQPTFM
ncbi:transposase [Bizionia argentinensis]|uniref:transposase n=1 Tax=Bizionia argentinensis TaxID=456455 RepID=UPI0021CD5556|nr:transposase [Bizionia argentinensis]